MDVRDYQINARKRVLASTTLYDEADRKYGRLISLLRGNAPRSLGVAYLIQVNPDVEDTPDSTIRSKRGCMQTDTKTAKELNIPEERMDTPATSIYLWSREFNSLASTFYTNKSALFSIPGEDFWKTVYLNYILGSDAFGHIWRAANPVIIGGVYDSLLYVVNAGGLEIPGYPDSVLRTIVLGECEFTYALWKLKGKFVTEGFGILPVPSKTLYNQIYMGDRTA